jgi:hypothetical protein
MALLARQVRRARRRLFLGSLLVALAWGWVTALAVAACWFLVQPYLVPTAPDWLRWAVLAALAGAGTLAGAVVAVLRAPSALSAALTFDERFALKERVTTSLALAPDEAASPAGQALLADVEQRLAPLRVGDRFPVRLPWRPAALLPLGAALLALIALFWQPRPAGSQPGEADGPQTAEAKADVEQEIKRLASRPQAKKPEDQVKPEELARIEAEVEKFTKKPRETREEVRERIKDATALEDEIRREQKERAGRVDAFKEQMRQAERMKEADRLKRKARNDKPDGPARNAADALARGDMEQARDELERLSRELQKEEEKERLRRKKKDPKATEEEKKKAAEELERLERESNLTRKEREALQKQLEELEQQLQRLTRTKEEIAQELKDMAQRGDIDKEQLDRELEQLDKNMEKLSPEEIKELAEALKECRECMKEGKDGEAAAKLAKAARKAGQMGEGNDLARKLVQVQQVRRALVRALNNKGGPGAGRRPESKDRGDTGAEEKWAPGEHAGGKVEVVGHGPSGGFKGPRKPSEMAEEIRQAAQEAPAAIDRQRLPASARKMARGYFEKVRGPDRKDDKKKP